MAKLARKITKATFDKLSKDLQGSYVVNDDDDDEYILELDESDDENPDALRRARDREKKRAKDAAAELKKAQDRLKELEAGADDDETDTDDTPPRNKRRKAKDIQTLDASWKEKYAALEAERDEKLSAKDQVIKKTLINNAANTLAAKISTAPRLLAKAIVERLDVDFEDDEPRLVVLDADGKPSSLTLDKLEKEFTGNKEFASIIIGTKASGGGAPRNGTDKRPASGAASGETPDFSKMPAKELAARLKEIKEAT